MEGRSDDNSISAMFADKSQSFSPVLHTNSQNWMELWRVTESIRHSTTMTDGKDYVTTADDVRLAVGKLFFPECRPWLVCSLTTSVYCNYCPWYCFTRISG